MRINFMRNKKSRENALNTKDERNSFDVISYLEHTFSVGNELEKQTKDYVLQIKREPIKLFLKDRWITIDTYGCILWGKKGGKTTDIKKILQFERAVYERRSFKSGLFKFILSEQATSIRICELEYDTAFDWFMPFGLRVDWSKTFFSDSNCSLRCVSESGLSEYKLDSIVYNVQDILEDIKYKEIPLYINDEIICTAKYVSGLSLQKRNGYIVATFPFLTSKITSNQSVLEHPPASPVV